MTKKFPNKKTEAKFSEDRAYRYSLSRIWDYTKPSLYVIMLNPSTANGLLDDATIKRLYGFAQRYDLYGSIIVMNLFAFVSTNPTNLFTTNDPIGPDNLNWLATIPKDADVLCAWGANIDKLLKAIPKAKELYAGKLQQLIPGKKMHLGLTKKGHPRHPLYVADKTEFSEFNLNFVNYLLDN